MPAAFPIWLERLWSLGETSPCFGHDFASVGSETKRMRATPVASARPVLVLAGYRAWPQWVAQVREHLRELVVGSDPHARFLSVAYPFTNSLDACVQKAAREARRGLGARNDEAVEIDIVAVSMGGLIGRMLALPSDMTIDGIRGGGLRVRRLFTLGTPHRGASLAAFLRPDDCARRMRPGSSFLKALDEAWSGGIGRGAGRCEMVCYARTNDWVSGARNCAPPWMETVWVPGTRFLSHVLIASDQRIMVDIARRLRGETPLANAASRPDRD